jgi:hypothetical protein
MDAAMDTIRDTWRRLRKPPQLYSLAGVRARTRGLCCRIAEAACWPPRCAAQPPHRTRAHHRSQLTWCCVTGG